MHRLGKDVSVPCNELADSDLSVDFACTLKRQVDQWDALDTLPQELCGVFSVPGSWHHIYRLGRSRLDIDIAKPIDIEQAFQVEDVHLYVQTEGNRSGRLSLAHGIVEKFEMDALVGAER